MSSTIEQRLESWREVVRSGGPRWLTEAAPRIVRELEAELAARDSVSDPQGEDTEGG
jgi:hypothetical protein